MIEPGLSANGDPDGIRQVVEILLDNAIKYANPGGWVTLSLTRAGRRIAFTVANSGPEIAKEDLGDRRRYRRRSPFPPPSPVAYATRSKKRTSFS
ncbi:ATP-binding protein [Litorilinea aerophila]|uniref:ATP-binding protein n=1 Tax=Litorilinea aerophila TaxID=1204385 RepID=A0A540VHD5_9CHLR